MQIHSKIALMDMNHFETYITDMSQIFFEFEQAVRVLTKTGGLNILRKRTPSRPCDKYVRPHCIAKTHFKKKPTLQTVTN